MTTALALVRLLPWPFLGRLAAAFVEISVAVVILSGSVVVGHYLGEWRAWYGDPATGHPWSPSAKPSATVAALAMPAVAIPVGITQRSFLCRTSTGERLVLEHPAGNGMSDCVKTVWRADGTHLVIETFTGAVGDFGVIAMPSTVPAMHLFAPSAWSSPVLVMTGAPAANAGMVIVLSWQGRAPIELFRGGGQNVDVATDASGWPRITLRSTDGLGHSSISTYVWSGAGFGAQ
jgi:hypothetical protein